MTSIDRRRVILGAAGAVMLRIPLSRAQTSTPELKAMQFVVPAPPGTQPDLIARWLAPPIAKAAGIPVTVLNRPGAAGAIAADAVLASSDTGALLLGGLDHVAYSHLNSNRRALDPFVDFVPVGAVNRDTWVIVTGVDAGIATLGALTELGRSQTPISYASNGEGSTAHLLSARLCRMLGISAQHVAYRDTMLPDLFAGRVAFAVMPTPGAVSQIRAGRLRALASLTRTRLPSLPQVPTLGELGHDGLVFHGGLFLFAPAALGLHARKINQWLVEAQRQPEVAAAYAAASIDPTPFDLEQTRHAVADRLRIIDEMRSETFGRGRTG